MSVVMFSVHVPLAIWKVKVVPLALVTSCLADQARYITMENPMKKDFFRSRDGEKAERKLLPARMFILGVGYFNFTR